jgi:segregation and condensation protein A
MTDPMASATAARVTAEDVAAWEDPPRAARSAAAPVLAVEGFAGPLDWLLELARAKKLDLAKLSIAALIEAFATAMQAGLAGRDTDRIGHWAVWTVMAATLTELWSRLLLPANSPEAKAAQAEAEALRQQLLNRARMRSAADWLERRPQLGRDVFARGRPEISLGGGGGAGDLTELLRACLVALRVPEALAETYRPRPPPLWRVTDALVRLDQLLGELPDGSPLTAFLPAIGGEDPGRTLRCRAAVSSTLIAGLERARDGALTLDQAAEWTPILVRRGDRQPDGLAEGPSG